MPAGARRGLFVPLMTTLFAVMWLCLWLWEQSPYGRYLNHGDWTEIGLAGSLCRIVPAGSALLPAGLYVGGWVVMTAAMMLPTTLPLLDLFRRITAGRRDRTALLLLVVGGYLAMWGLFGAAAHALDQALARAASHLPWLAFNGWAVGAAVLGLAGGYQFTSWKYRCLDRCRTPMSFLIQHWRGTAVRRRAFLLGLHHGAFCVGCCWALMLLMFVVGTGNVGVMLGLGLVMAAEKNLPWGRRLGAPLGAALIAWAALIVLQHGASLA